MEMRGLILLSSIILFFSTVNKASAQEQNGLLCISNAVCFEPEPVPEPIVVKDSIEREVNPTTEENLALIPFREPEQEEFKFEENLERAGASPSVDDLQHQQSKFYEIIDFDRPFFNKRFMNVPSRDMIWQNDPELESTRPNFILKQFNEPRPLVDFNWEAGYY